MAKGSTTPAALKNDKVAPAKDASAKKDGGVRDINEEEVATHNSEQDCWIIVGNESTGGPKVYDVTKYLSDHPGGPEIITEFAGRDADDMFENIGE